ncbi:hypothetical protein [Dictyobacter aurantiacus]|uniref:Uncharacterized protein n=1 Tax=Dictyobacter aurantiacus TaxID=1936993 RepID=A0A401ZKI7_9CHLR|nr:hypothetical protein [Dictyobacter aurantiacus]GCE07369.1 hypothetical protein KDAU_46980 [Dictyobacter aurantiacus]
MVRAISDTLAAAMRASTRVPAIGVSIEDHIQHYQAYQSPGTPDGWHDACVAGDGSIVRVRLTRGSGAYSQSLQWQRITNPDSASQWSSWSTLGGASATCFEDSGCAISNNGGILRTFAQQGSGGALWTWSSSDNGQSWSASPTSVLTPPGGTSILGIGSAGNNDVFFLYQISGGVVIGCSLYSGGSWSSLRSSTLSAIPYGAGLTACWDGSLYWLIFSDGNTLYESTYDPGGNSWQGLPAVAPATGNAITRRAPRLQYDPSSELYTLACIEADSGQLTGAVYSYPRLRQSADLQHWSQGSIVHSMSAQYGACPLGASNANLLISMSSVLKANAYRQDSQHYLDCGSRVISYSLKEHLNKPAEVEMVLDGGQGVVLSQPGATGPIGPNCSLVLRAGYRSGTAPGVSELVKVGTYRIQSMQLERSAGVERLRLLCGDLTQQLDQVNRFQMTYTAQPLSWLLREVCARAGLFALALPASSQLSQSVPQFVLPAGGSYRHALDELCHIYDLQYFLDQDEVLQFQDLNAGVSASWSYQAEIERLSWGQRVQGGNHIIVTGKPPAGGSSMALTTAEVYDDQQMQWSGREGLIQHVDQKLLTVAQCASKASFLLAQQQRARQQHQVQVPFNPVHQLLDVISISDASGTIGGNARIVSSSSNYEPQQAIYSTTLELEGV